MRNDPKNILFVSPCSNKDNFYRSLMAPALGCLRLTGFLNGRGHNAEYYDPNVRNVRDDVPTLEEKFAEKDWDFIGFSLLEETLQNDLRNIHLAHIVCPSARLIAGGIEAQFNYQNVLDKSPCEIVIAGEGEIPMLMLAEGKSIDTIPGVVFKSRAKPLDQETFDEATGSIAFEDIDYEKYWDFYVDLYGESKTFENDEEIHTVRLFSRNRCPIACKFCSSTNQLTWGSGETVPVISASHETLLSVVDRIIVSHPRVKTIYLTDDDFCINKRDVMRFCEKVIARNYENLTFMCFARATDITEEMLGWMYKANFRRLNIGVESFSPNVLDEMNKRCRVDQIYNALDLVKKSGIKGMFSMILTSPESKIDDVEVTVDEALKFVTQDFCDGGAILAIRPYGGTEFSHMYCDHKSEVLRIDETHGHDLGKNGFYLQRDDFIWAKDPIVRELQASYSEGLDYVLSEHAKEQNLAHKTSSNIVVAQLNFMKRLINKARECHGLYLDPAAAE
jgi:radical SAM superfamily enzyme YgiQ (UPF0313 family)